MVLYIYIYIFAGSRDFFLPDSSLDHFLWINTRLGVDRLTHDIQIILWHNWWSIVNWLARTVKDSPQHVFADRRFHDLTGELNARMFGIDSRSTFENLNDGLVAMHFKNLSSSFGAIEKC